MLESGGCIRVLLADDDASLRRHIRDLLESEGDIAVVGEAADGVHAVGQAAELAPDVVIVDVRMPRATGLQATRAIHDATPTTKILVVTVSDDEADRYEAIRAGANGYLLKDAGLDEVADAVRAVVQGHSLLSPAMAAKLLTEFKALSPQSGGRPSGPALSAREVEVLKLVALGLRNRDVAHRLHLAESTVKTHLANILAKLHLRCRLEAVTYAFRAGLIEPG